MRRSSSGQTQQTIDCRASVSFLGSDHGNDWWTDLRVRPGRSEVSRGDAGGYFVCSSGNVTDEMVKDYYIETQTEGGDPQDGDFTVG